MKDNPFHNLLKYLIPHGLSACVHDLSYDIFNPLNGEHTFESHIGLDILSILGWIDIVFLHLFMAMAVLFLFVFSFTFWCIFFFYCFVVFFHIFEQDVY